MFVTKLCPSMMADVRVVDTHNTAATLEVTR